MRAPSVTIGGSGTVAGEEAALIQQMENHLSTLNPSDQDKDEDYNGRRVLHPRVLYVHVYNGSSNRKCFNGPFGSMFAKPNITTHCR